MKYLLILILFNINSVFADPNHFSKDYEVSMFMEAAKYSCFVQQRYVWSFHAWEKNHTQSSYIWLLIEKDDKGILVAQPSSFCEEQRIDPAKCVYWIRTVDINEWWLPEGTRFVKCPKYLNKKRISDYVKKNYNNEFEVKNDQ